jgi:hypothetical protein
MLQWNAKAHTDDENARWCWERASEWLGRLDV